MYHWMKPKKVFITKCYFEFFQKNTKGFFLSLWGQDWILRLVIPIAGWPTPLGIPFSIVFLVVFIWRVSRSASISCLCKRLSWFHKWLLTNQGIADSFMPAQLIFWPARVRITFSIVFISHYYMDGFRTPDSSGAIRKNPLNFMLQAQLRKIQAFPAKSNT